MKLGTSIGGSIGQSDKFNVFDILGTRRSVMKQFSGFVPIKFHLAGKLLLILGFIGLILVGVSKLTGWFMLPSAVLFLSLIAILVSLYLIFVVPREKTNKT